jgi:hypothetical protein
LVSNYLLLPPYYHQDDLYPRYREANYVFTTVLVNITVFLICFLMGSIKLKIGFAFGLFAVFSILRYRTETDTH